MDIILPITEVRIKTMPMFIPKETDKIPSPNSVECSLKQNLFDPNISSPPNDWMIKLQSRVHNYYNNSRSSENK